MSIEMPIKVAVAARHLLLLGGSLLCWENYSSDPPQHAPWLDLCHSFDILQELLILRLAAFLILCGCFSRG